MAKWSLDRTVFPPSVPFDELVALVEGVRDGSPTTLGAESGETVALPPEVFEVLRNVVSAMADGQAITVAPVREVLTTGEAADLLDISPQDFAELLAAGEIPYEQVGLNRKVRLTAVLAFRQRRQAI